MRREDVRPLLLDTVDRLPEPELADKAWAAGLVVQRRRRLTVAISVIAVIAVAIVASLLIEVGEPAGNADLTPPTRPPGYVEPSGKINGIDYWVAPPPGSERFLDRLDTPLGDRLELPDKVRKLEEHPLSSIAAVTVVKDGEQYTPLLLGTDGTWVRADVTLTAVGGAAPLSTGTVSPDGRIAAFPQRGGVVTVNVATVQISHHPLPDGEYRSVSWVADARRILVGGPTAAYQVLVGAGNRYERSVVQVAASGDPNEATSPYSLQNGSMMRYLFNGRWTEDHPLVLPVRSWQGQTFSSLSAAARIFVAEDLPQVRTRVSQPQVLAAISTVETLPSRLLVLGEPQDNPPARERAGDRPFEREVGCCAVLGWYDDDTVMFRVRGWVLAWNLDNGRVRRVTELGVGQVALGPGLRA